MQPAFVQVRAHSEKPAPPPAEGRVVLSRLGRGECLVARPSVSVKFVLEGEERYEFDGAVHTVRGGQMLVADTGPASRVVLPRREETRGLCLYLPAWTAVSAPSDGPPLLPAATPLVMPVAATPLGRLLDRAARYLAERPEAGARLARRLVPGAALALSRLVADRHEALGRLSALKPSTRAEILRRLELARAHLHLHPERTVPLAELAAVAGLSQFHLARSFAEAFGAPPAAYHRRLRLEQAADALRRGRLSPAGAARVLGFAEPGGFTRAFRRQYGVPPSAVLPRVERN